MTDFALNSEGTAEIRVAAGEFNGKRHIGCRVWRKWAGNDELRPTKQGVNIPLDLAVDVGRAIIAAAEGVGK